MRAVFLRGMGAVYLIAFTSLGRQVLGLYGKRGILPAAEFLERVRTVVTRERYRQFPTLLWLGSSDRALSLHCKAGQVAAVALLLDVAPRMSALTAWALYLSLVTVGQEFLSFQWDVLLLEAGLLTVLVAPPGFAPGIRAVPPSAPAVALMRWLVFRLYVESGAVKLRSGDPTWRSLSACCYHYATQPLPNRIAWYAHHLPRSILRLSTGAALAVEIAVPFFVLGSRGARRVAFCLLSGLQAAFALTGISGSSISSRSSWACGCSTTRHWPRSSGVPVQARLPRVALGADRRRLARGHAALRTVRGEARAAVREEPARPARDTDHRRASRQAGCAPGAVLRRELVRPLRGDDHAAPRDRRRGIERRRELARVPIPVQAWYAVTAATPGRASPASARLAALVRRSRSAARLVHGVPDPAARGVPGRAVVAE